MYNFIKIEVTFIVTAASVVLMMPAACGSPIPPGNSSQVEQTAETKNPEDCLWNQFLNPNLSCEDCTFCPHGTEHSPNEQCGNGLGTKTTCKPCAEGFFQTGEGYTGLVCSPCVVCYPNFTSLQNCKPTQDARCACPPGWYEFQDNICLECEHEPSHPDCLATTIKPSTAPPNQSAPTTTSVDTTPSAPLSSQAHNTSNDFDEEGTPIKKFSVLGIIAIVIVIVICVILLACLAYKKWIATNNLANGHVLPSKSPDGESGQLIPSPAIDVATPGPAIAAPAVVTPAPAVVTPAPAIATPAPAIVTPAPAIATPAPAIATPAPGSAAPGPAIVTPGPAIATPAPAIATPAPVSDLLQGASNPGDPAASLPTDVSNTETSVPGALCSDGGPVGDHDAWYQNQQNHDPGSPDSAKVNFLFENDEGSVLSLPLPLKSNEEALISRSYHD